MTIRAKVIGTAQDRHRRLIKEAIENKKKGDTMNRDEGQYFITHAFDELLEKITRKKINWQL